MPGRSTARILLMLLLIGSGCKKDRVSLRGYFGDPVGDIPHVLNLIPAAGEATPLPSYWVRGVPLLSFTGKHKPLYLDTSQDPEAQDTLEVFGVESSTLAFYVGHGDIDFWSNPDEPPNNSVELARVRVGDGLLRYFWLYSCNVLAHGPRINNDFPLPHRFQSGDEDIFRRWAPAFGPRLRMVCGGSTRLGFAQVGEVWNHLFEEERSVADAFILGTAHQGQVPACLARGGPSPGSSALMDRTLLTDGIEGDESKWLHFQYALECKVAKGGTRVHCGEPPPPATEPSSAGITSVPRIATEAMPPPIQPEEGRLPLGFLPLPSKGPFIKDLKYSRASGAVVLVKRRDPYTRLAPCNKVTTWNLSPWDFLGESGFSSMGFLPSAVQSNTSSLEISRRLTAFEMRVESRQEGASIEDRKCWVHGLFLRSENTLELGKQPFPIFGSTMTVEVKRPENPELASFSAPHRALTLVPKKDHPVKSSETAIAEARQELHLDPETYPAQNERAILGYEEAPLRCEQYFLRPTYEIRFAPATSDHPTIVVRRDARGPTDTSGPSWVCQGWDG